ncbi:MAG TPA: integrase core domain-containing protein [Xanthomonadaceae bacterium]|nr:integrase core domain-containing protein [Xanthomonadaceae bacterium]
MAAWALDIQDAGAAMLLAVILLLMAVWAGCSRHRACRPQPIKRRPANDERQGRRNQRKPDWVIAEVLRLKALAPNLSCRDIADIFDRRFAVARQMTVSKTWVHHILRKRKVEVLRLRRELKHRVPKSLPRNRVWAMDLTGKGDLTGKQRILLGLLDHGTRACLALRELADKSSLTILRELIAAFRRFGMPKAIRTDNEACFNSWLMRGALRLLGIHHQTTEPGCPWMNGRIERYFGSLKAVLDRIHIADGDDLACRLIEFRAWYNHVRAHRHLDNRTPAEAWAGREKSRRTPTFFEVWDGMLRGWYFPQ